jgi:UDP-N-acetylglucosamine 2-epimerase (non-hydrolysing)
MSIKTLFIFGTRPEAIKLAPVVLCLKSDPRFQVNVCVTAQHRQMLDQVLAAFKIRPDYDLDQMVAGQTLTGLTARVIAGLEPVLTESQPDWVIVQGDTTTTFCGALAGFYQKINVAHVEAGLRTFDLQQPFPEEANRLLTARLATAHLAATETAKDNLVREGVDQKQILVTGNTGIDAVFQIRDQIRAGKLHPNLPFADDGKRLVLVTAHRRESFGEGMRQICVGLNRIAELPNVRVVFPVHPNPNVRKAINEFLLPRENVILLEPQDYVPFVALMDRADVLLTDSGGVQEEAPSLGKPTLVMRDKTERPEAVTAGSSRLVGVDAEAIFSNVAELLQDPLAYQKMAQVRPVYGDGRAAERIRDWLAAKSLE